MFGVARHFYNLQTEKTFVTFFKQENVVKLYSRISNSYATFALGSEFYIKFHYKLALKIKVFKYKSLPFKLNFNQNIILFYKMIII